jgi:hypothetical protein
MPENVNADDTGVLHIKEIQNEATYETANQAGLPQFDLRGY